MRIVTSSVANPSRWFAINLTAATALVALGDLVWGRTGARMLLPQGGFSNALNSALMATGGYFGHLTGVLSLALLLLALTNAEVRQRIFPRPLQVSLVFVAAVFVLLSGRALVGPMGERFTLYTKITYAFMAAFVMAGVLRSSFGRQPESKRHRRSAMGVLLFALPGILYAAASFVDRNGTPQATEVATVINRIGQWAALAAGLGAGLLLSPPSRGHMRSGTFAVASALGVIGTASAFAFLLLRFDLVSSLAAAGLGIEVPRFTESGGNLFAVVFAAAAGSTLFGLATLLGARGQWRLVGYGLLLVTAAGYQLSNPALLAASLVGLMAMALGVFAVSRPVHAPNEQSRQSAERPHQDVNPSEHQPPAAAEV